MKSFLIFILLCSVAYGANEGITVVSSKTSDPERKTESTEDVVSRDGKRILIRDAKTKNGELRIRIHRFYVNEKLVGTYVAMPESSSFSTEAGTPYAIGLELDGAKNPKSVTIGTKDGMALDWFTYSAGIFSPVERSQLEKANALSADIKRLFDPKHVQETSPEQFGKEAQELVEKHKAK